MMRTAYPLHIHTKFINFPPISSKISKVLLFLTSLRFLLNLRFFLPLYFDYVVFVHHALQLHVLDAPT